MSIKLNGATNGSIELDVPAAVGSDLNVTIPATAGELTVKGTDGSVDLGDVTIDSSGNVGIGTTSPDGTLHVQGTNSGGTLEALVLKNNATATNTETAIRFTNTTSTFNHASIVGTRSGSGTLDFYTADSASPAMRIDSSGKLLLGTTSEITTNTTLETTVPSGNNQVWCNSENITDGEGTYFAARAEVNNSNERSCRIGTYKHSNITNACAYIFMDEEDGQNAYFWTDNSRKLRVSGTAGHIGTTSGTVVGTQTSDERLKNIVGPVEYGLETLKQIEAVRYTLKSEPDTEKMGFLAQQVQPLIPESVFDTKEHIEGEPEDAPTQLGMEYVALIPVLVNAIKELSAEVDALKGGS